MIIRCDEEKFIYTDTEAARGLFSFGFVMIFKEDLAPYSTLNLHVFNLKHSKTNPPPKKSVAYGGVYKLCANNPWFSCLPVDALGEGRYRGQGGA